LAGPTFYDELGVAADASDETLRAEYRRRARQLHPDVAQAADSGDAMRRLNEAWAVLGDPELRRRYDERLAAGAPVPPRAPVADPPPSVAVPPPGSPGRGRRIPFLRPSALILVTLAVLFLVTAYAGSWPGKSGGPPGPGITTVPGPAAVHPVGLCLATVGSTGLNTIVPCTEPNAGQILAEVTDARQCPAGTVGHLWTLRSSVLCATAPPAP
jgi:hypothetical protein